MMKFKPGDRVKFRRYPHDHAPYWVAGVYQGWDMQTHHHIVKSGPPEHLSDREEHVGDRDITAYKPVTDEEVTANGVKHAETLVGLIEKYQTALLLPKHRVKVINNDGSLVLSPTSLSIDPAVFEVTSIGGITEFPGWEVNLWKTVYNYPHAPDDVDSESKGTARTPEAAARLAVETLWRITAAQMFEHEDEKAWADSLAEEPEIPEDYFREPIQPGDDDYYTT